jgi:hypothetical protein
MLESFAVQEIRRQLGVSHENAEAYHFRTATGHEVDLVLEAPGPRIVGVEVKASSAVSEHDFKGLRTLAEAAGQRFVRGAVLYLGDQRLRFSDDLWALPISALWHP